MQYQPRPRAPQGPRQRPPEEERRIVRQSMLKASVEWLGVVYADAGTKPTSSDVLKLAEKFEQWVYR